MANKSKSIAPHLLDLVTNCAYPFKTPFVKEVNFSEIPESAYSFALDFLWDKIVKHITNNHDRADIVYDKIKRNIIHPPLAMEDFDEDTNRLVLTPKTLKSTLTKRECSAKTLDFFEALDIVVKAEEEVVKDLRRVSGYYNTYNLHNTKLGTFQVSNLHISLTGSSYVKYISKRYWQKHPRKTPINIEVVNKDKLLITCKEDDFRLVFYAYIGKENAPQLIQAVFMYNNTDGYVIGGQGLFHRVDSEEFFADPLREQTDILLKNEKGNPVLDKAQQQTIIKYLFNRAHFNKPTFTGSRLKFDFTDLALEPAPAKQSALFYNVTKTLCGCYHVYYNERYMTEPEVNDNIQHNTYYSTVGRGILEIYEEQTTGVIHCRMATRKNKNGERIIYKGHIENSTLNDQSYIIISMYANSNTRFINLILAKAGGDYLLGSHNIMYEPALELGTGPVIVIKKDKLTFEDKLVTISPCPKIKDDSVANKIVNYLSRNSQGLNTPITRFSDLEAYKNLRIEGIYKMYSYGKGGIRLGGLKINKSGFVQHIGCSDNQPTYAYGHADMVGSIAYIVLRDVSSGRLGFLVLRVAENEPEVDKDNPMRNTIYVGTFSGATRRNEQHPIALRIVLTYTGKKMSTDLTEAVEAQMFKGENCTNDANVPPEIRKALLQKDSSFTGFLKRRISIFDYTDLKKFNEASFKPAEVLMQRAVYHIMKNDTDNALLLLERMYRFPDVAGFIEQFEREIKEINVNSDFLENEKYLSLKGLTKD